jgi:hypothetical protein
MAMGRAMKIAIDGLAGADEAVDEEEEEASLLFWRAARKEEEGEARLVKGRTRRRGRGRRRMEDVGDEIDEVDVRGGTESMIEGRARERGGREGRSGRGPLETS